ncbi:MAG: Xaa-Pro peptidase family protein [Candidatus Saccharibacteria bacterium]
MDKSLTSQFFKANRDKLFSSLGSKVLIVTANAVLQKSSDEAYDFNQDPSFWYLTGTLEADLILVKTEYEEFIVVPNIYVSRQSVIEPLDETKLKSISGVGQVLYEREGWAKIKTILAKSSSYATLSPNSVLLKHHGMYTNPARRQLVSRIRRMYPKLAIEDVRANVARLRMAKQPVEIKLIQKAIDITTATLNEVLAYNNLSKYKNTSEIEEDILDGFISRGADGHAFGPIVSSGPHTAYIHYQKLNEPLKSGDLIVCDVGSIYSLYKADITRTVIYGKPSARQQAVYDAVKRVQAEAYKMIKPGMDFKTYEDRVTELNGEELRKLGLIKKLDRKSIRKYYMTYCTHSLGLDTHDGADYSTPLPENMIMTVEPGIYIKEEGIGVRIEDDIQITKDGCKILSSSLPLGLKL